MAFHSVIGSEARGVAKGFRPADETIEEIAETRGASDGPGVASVPDVTVLTASWGCGRARAEYASAANESNVFITQSSTLGLWSSIGSLPGVRDLHVQRSLVGTAIWVLEFGVGSMHKLEKMDLLFSS